MLEGIQWIMGVEGWNYEDVLKEDYSTSGLLLQSCSYPSYTCMSVLISMHILTGRSLGYTEYKDYTGCNGD